MTTTTAIRVLDRVLDAATCATVLASANARTASQMLASTVEMKLAAGAESMSAGPAANPLWVAETADPRLVLRLYLRARPRLPEHLDGLELCAFRPTVQVLLLGRGAGSSAARWCPANDVASAPRGHHRQHRESLLVAIGGAIALETESAGRFDLQPGDAVVLPAAEALRAFAPAGPGPAALLHAAVDYAPGGVSGRALPT